MPYWLTGENRKAREASCGPAIAGAAANAPSTIAATKEFRFFGIDVPIAWVAGGRQQCPDSQNGAWSPSTFA
jgi:hypothetical protein